ncbi:hypothetical protein ACUXMI_005725 [Cupriavidus metallidurans]|nr:hypothetical protein AU374_05769 [Cupriavidus metallidurans]
MRSTAVPANRSGLASFPLFARPRLLAGTTIQAKLHVQLATGKE